MDMFVLQTQCQGSKLLFHRPMNHSFRVRFEESPIKIDMTLLDEIFPPTTQIGNKIFRRLAIMASSSLVLNDDHAFVIYFSDDGPVVICDSKIFEAEPLSPNFLCYACEVLYFLER